MCPRVCCPGSSAVKTRGTDQKEIQNVLRIYLRTKKTHLTQPLDLPNHRFEYGFLLGVPLVVYVEVGLQNLGIVVQVCRNVAQTFILWRQTNETTPHQMTHEKTPST